MIFSHFYHLCLGNKRYFVYGAGSLSAVFASVSYIKYNTQWNKSSLVIHAETKKNKSILSSGDLKSAPDDPGAWNTIMLLKLHLLSEWPNLLLCLVSSVAQAVLGMCLPAATATLARWIWTSSSGSSNFGKPWIYFITCVTGQAIMSFINIILVNRYCDKVVHKLQLALYTSLLMDKAISFFDSNSTGHLMHRITTDPQEFRHALKILLSNGVRHIASLILSVVQLASISPRWTISLSICIPIATVIGHSYGSILRKANRLYHREQALATGRLTQVLGHIRMVLAFLGEQFELDHYKKSLEMIQRASEHLAFHTAVYTSCIQWSIQMASMLGVLVLASPASSDAPHETLTKFLVIAQQAQSSLSQINGLYAQSLKALQSGSRIVEWISFEPDVRILPTNETIQPSDITDIKGPRITFDKVSFSYPGRGKLFDKLSLILHPGETVAICGPSGSGKSTIASLLERFYDPEDGTIYINDVPINVNSNKLLTRRQIGYIPQEPVLFDDTILNNIRYGIPSATKEQVMNAAKQAHIHEFITETLPKQYDTIVGERGIALSGGQKQRIAIARAILKNPSILILDEATSALDHESEMLVQNALTDAMKGRTVITIAHRWSTIQRADRIVVIRHGRIVEYGTFEELLNAKGALYALYQANAIPEQIK